MEQKPPDTVGEFGVGRLFPEMAPRQPGPTSGLKVHFTNDRGRCDRSAEFANSVPPFLLHWDGTDCRCSATKCGPRVWCCFRQSSAPYPAAVGLQLTAPPREAAWCRDQLIGAGRPVG